MSVMERGSTLIIQTPARNLVYTRVRRALDRLTITSSRTVNLFARLTLYSWNGQLH